MKTKDALQWFKTATALAAALKIKPQAISQWGETVPPRRQYEIERITHGALKAETGVV